MEGFEEKTSPNYLGVITAAIVLPIALIVYHFSTADMAVSTFLCLGAVVFAAAIRWRLRKFVWFWVVLLIVAALHIPLIMETHLPVHWVHGVVLFPVFIADLLIVLGAIRLAEALCSSDSRSS
jgi:glucose-6-phosphate-specific signal transduction histidine kinase